MGSMDELVARVASNTSPDAAVAVMLEGIDNQLSQLGVHPQWLQSFRSARPKLQEAILANTPWETRRHIEQVPAVVPETRRPYPNVPTTIPATATVASTAPAIPPSEIHAPPLRYATAPAPVPFRAEEEPIVTKKSVRPQAQTRGR